MKKTPRSLKSPRKSVSVKISTAEMTPDEVVHLEQISRRYEESERAWQMMTAPPDGEDVWTKVEEHLLTSGTEDQDRRWKFFSK
jgi:hypothetical protein